jgi:uncharacterized protein
MRLEHYDKEKLEKEILKIVGKYLNLSEYRLFFFGSRVSDKGDEHSDIDIGIKGPKPVPSDAILSIQEELENLPVLYKIEIVDFGKVDDRFRQVALQHVEPLKV